MTINEMKKRKKELGYSNLRLSELSGVPVGTIQKIFSGETASPRYNTVQAIARVLAKSEARELHDISLAYSTAPGTSIENRSGASSHNNTIENYYALPEGTRVELIDGKFYDMSAPSTIHQCIGAELLYLLKGHISKNEGSCVPFIAPTDVQLDCDDKTMLQPDVFVVCDRSKITKNCIVGAPDLVIEIVSPGNVTTDVMIKLFKYQKAGVREYWIIFPDEQNVVVYDFAKKAQPVQYTFNDAVPVSIWNGACEIDFKYIYSQVKYMY